MISSLPLFHRIHGQPVIVLGEGEAAEAKRRLVERAGGLVIKDMQEGIDKGARLAFVAHDNPDAIEGDSVRMRCAGLLVNVVDQPELCDFTVPSILDRSPVLLAIGTGGASAGLAKALRIRLEGLLPPSLGSLATALNQARGRLRARWPDAGDRRRALDSALAQGSTLDPLDEHAVARVTEWLEQGQSAQPAGCVEMLLSSSDPDDLTLKQARLLGSADQIFHEPEVSPAILNRARADAARSPLHNGEAPQPTGGLILILRAPPER